MPEFAAHTRLNAEEVRARLRTFVSAPIAGNATLVAAPGVGYQIVVYGFSFQGQDTDADNTIRLSDSGGSLLTQNFVVNQDRTIQVPPNSALTPIARCAENTSLDVVVTGTTPALTAQVWFTRERI